MSSRQRLTQAALEILDSGGLSGFSTRAACERAGVKAPTLYHHFGDADGLISAAAELGFEQFLKRKLTRAPANDPAVDLMEGWDDYLAFARERPKLYLAMTARHFGGGSVAAAQAGRLHLEATLARLEEQGRLRLPVAAAADLVWATAHAGALLFAAASPGAPSHEVIATLRGGAESVLALPSPT